MGKSVLMLRWREGKTSLGFSDKKWSCRCSGRLDVIRMLEAAEIYRPQCCRNMVSVAFKLCAWMVNVGLTPLGNGMNAPSMT